MKLLTLFRGNEKAIVEAGSEAEKTMTGLGFALDRAATAPKPKTKPTKKKGTK